MRASGNIGRSPANRGFVIVAVLWILLALSSLAIIFSAYLAASARALAASDLSLQTEALVSAGLELTAYQLTLTDDKTRPQYGAFQFWLDDASVGVTFTSEAGRLDLNYAPKEMLIGLFVVLGARKDAASEYADRIVGWRTRPAPGSENVEAARYNALGYSPRQGLFTHVNELALVAGIPEAFVDRVLPFVTVFNGGPDVDPTIAAPEVALAVDKASGKDQDGFGARPASPNGIAAGTQAPNQQSAASTAQSPCYRIAISIRFRNGHRTTSEAVIALGDKVEPYRVLSWQNDVEPRNPVLLRKRG
ncbi:MULTISPECIES: general secretion pathway protein GspK [Bradyrhizobium]|jgi:general secretion pathway protein K|uniref:general secretion pathway protein GspK n=1 Tax=Bradyrhizobium TaxID=374 RepID=UPI0004B789EF|nr:MULTISPECIES: type II secretion system protein GspK [Bradyrhizobium]MCS3445882.1 general secretion pathway protein K [Bradyrhizobium elkanii]MCS3562986.1 general secretion pathway protein K [Bradyrhizobium elkanii]MCW2147178.1 general secretion pathway protein K [Bradyrhizobium elkanii]MCW2353744.1 general secretion pathway protein K [Bradyrhizobium elkanii]MCW2380009.1 general secretion pathway protein K [Bradyrhizobium elkanii]